MTTLQGESRCSSLIILYAIFSYSFLMLISEGTEHIVGDSNGWELFINYTNWTQGREFHVGDVLVFNYASDEHNIIQVNSTAYANCGRDNYTSIYDKGNDTILISEVGELWFICGVGDHCESGQKLNINVAP